LIKSTTTLTDIELSNKENPRTSKTRPLYDQSPSIINLDMTYAHPTWGTTLAVGANLTGKRISLVKSQSPDIYEHPPITLDLSISQKFWKHWSARFAVRNVLDQEFLRTVGPSREGSVYQSYQKGRTFALSLTAEF
jgi:outer membrane receptor protein involved in Fe transport